MSLFGSSDRRKASGERFLGGDDAECINDTITILG